MPIPWTCPACGRSGIAPDSARGKKAKCKCGQSIGLLDAPPPALIPDAILPPAPQTPSSPPAVVIIREERPRETTRERPIHQTVVVKEAKRESSFSQGIGWSCGCLTVLLAIPLLGLGGCLLMSGGCLAFMGMSHDAAEKLRKEQEQKATVPVAAPAASTTQVEGKKIVEPVEPPPFTDGKPGPLPSFIKPIGATKSDPPKGESKPAEKKLPPETAEERAERRAGPSLRAAKTLLQDGTRQSRAKAESLLDDVIRDYPKTNAAKEAKELLDKLK